MLRHCGRAEGGSDDRRDEDRVVHAVDDLFVRGDDRGEHTAERGASFGDEVVGAETNAAAHGADGAGVAIVVGVLDDARVGEAHEDPGVMGKVGEGEIDGGGPILVRDIRADDNSPAAPGLR